MLRRCPLIWTVNCMHYKLFTFNNGKPVIQIESILLETGVVRVPRQQMTRSLSVQRWVHEVTCKVVQVAG